MTYEDGDDMSVDLRSDTVTKPILSMRASMVAADVDNNVYGEDPTVNRQEVAAELLVCVANY